jgi:hypothetical protein
MRKVFAAGVLGIGALAAGSVAVLVALTGDPGARARGVAPASSAFPIEAAPRAPGPTPPGAVTYGSEPSPQPVKVAAEPVTATPPPPPRDSWEAVPITSRARSLGRLGGLIQARLNEFHDELRACFTAEAQALRGGGSVTMVRDAAPMDDTGTLVLVLQLEGQAGAMRIVDAPVETRGPAGDELIACAQAFLRGRVLDVPGASAGTRQRLLFPLIP